MDIFLILLYYDINIPSASKTHKHVGIFPNICSFFSCEKHFFSENTCFFFA